MIDLARLNDLRSEIGEDDFQEVLTMFLEETDEVIALLGGAPDLHSVENRLHFLKGSALNLGLSELAQLCQIGEKSAASGNAAAVDLQQVTENYDASKAQLLAFLSRSLAA